MTNKKQGLLNLRKYRKQANLSQNALAEGIGVSRAAISLVEIGSNDPALSTALRIVAFLRKSGVNTCVEELAGVAPNG